jgi:hypothetical protein
MTHEKPHRIDGKLVKGPRPLHHTFDPSSKVNRAMMRRRRTLTPVARKAQRLAKVYSLPTMRRRAILWLVTRWWNA